ncbi:MAG TPA: MFS transporter [Rubrivivax sp.]|nr:MFS transporter [Rubrivivax sp.]
MKLLVKRPPGYWMRMITITGLLTAQSAPSTFLAIGLPTIYRQQGVDLATLSILALAAMPFWFKWLWAPLVDRLGSHRFGRRKSWIVPCTLAGAVAYAALGALPPTKDDIWLLVVFLTLIKLVMATQDIAVDAYTIESLEPGEEPDGATAAAVGSVIGGLMGSAVFLALFEQLGWTTVMALAALFLIVGTLPAMLRRERPPPEAVLADGPQPGPMRSLVIHLRSSATLAVLAAIFAFTMLGYLPFTVDGPFLVDKGLSLTEIGFLSGGGIIVGNLIGFTLSGRIAASIGLARTFALGAALVSLSVVGYVLIAALPSTALQVAIVMLIAQVVTCPAYIAMQASRFMWTDPRRVATAYTVQSSVNALAQSAARAAGPLLAGALGWPVFFAVAGGVMILAIWTMSRLHAKLTAMVEDRNRRPDPQPTPLSAIAGAPTS